MRNLEFVMFEKPVGQANNGVQRTSPGVTPRASLRGVVLQSVQGNQRGRGARGAPPRPYGPDGLAADAEAVRPSIELGRIV